MSDYLNDIKNWKKTGEKIYEAWLCMPPVGTSLANTQDNGTRFTNEKMRFVISGVLGEQWIVDGNTLARNYEFATGEKITPESLKKKVSEDGVLEWTKIKSISKPMDKFACLLPVNMFCQFPVTVANGEIVYANVRGIEHCDGDYLVCNANMFGKPDCSKVWLVDGKAFPTMFNLQNIQISDRAKSICYTSPEKPETLSKNNKNTKVVFEKGVARLLNFLGVSQDKIVAAIKQGQYNSRAYVVEANISKEVFGECRGMTHSVDLDCSIEYSTVHRYISFEFTSSREVFNDKDRGKDILCHEQFDFPDDNNDMRNLVKGFKYFESVFRKYNNVVKSDKLTYTNLLVAEAVWVLTELLNRNGHGDCQAVNKLNNISYAKENRGFNAEYYGDAPVIPKWLTIVLKEDSGVYSGCLRVQPIGPFVYIETLVWKGDMQEEPEKCIEGMTYSRMCEKGYKEKQMAKALSKLVKPKSMMNKLFKRG